MNVIQTIDLTKSYGEYRGISRMNLSVEAGECFGFIGPNGAGKSTTIRTLLGLISPTSGSAQVLGKDVTAEKNAILQDTGYLPSEAIFYRGMKVRDILRLSAGLRKKDCSEEAGRLCDRLQLDVSRNVDDLSFGNRKKVGIVCALQSRAPLLILDEPTSGLDPLMQREFFEILKERSQDGATIFFSSHILSEVQRTCSRAAIIREGEIIACDRVEALAKTSVKRISIHGNVDLRALEGIRDKTETDGTVSFLYNGDMDALMRTFSAGHISDISITEPDLEEIFLHFYEKEA